MSGKCRQKRELLLASKAGDCFKSGQACFDKQKDNKQECRGHLWTLSCEYLKPA